MAEHPELNKAVHVTKFNPGNFLDQIQIVDEPIPKPADDEVLVRIFLRPINPADVFSVKGMYPGFQPTLPAVPGGDGVGGVVALGSACHRLKRGQRVIAVPWPLSAGKGTWQQYHIMKEKDLVPVPDDVSDEFAAIIFVNPLSVIGMLEIAAVPDGEYLLCTAAGSALVRLLVPLAKEKGIKVIGTVRKREQVEAYKDIGAHALVATEDEDWPQQVRAITGGKGVYATLDAVAGTATAGAVKASQDHAKIYVYGLMEGLEVTASGVDIIFRDISIHSFYLALYFGSKSPEERQALVNQAWDLYRRGIFTARVEKEYPLEAIKEALQEVDKPGRQAKIMLRG